MWAWITMWWGCAEQPLVRSPDDFGPFVVVSGRLDSSLLDGSDDPAMYRGGIAWLVMSDASIGVTWQATPIEPRLFGYAMTVAGPPELQAVQNVDIAPSQLRWTDTRVALGLPVLYLDTPPPLDRDAFMLWALGTLPDASRIFGNGPSTVRAATTGHLLGLMATEPATATLGDTPEFVDEAPWCRWADVVPGLALYRDGGASCDGWRAIAYAQEYQGVDMVDVSTGP